MHMAVGGQEEAAYLLQCKGVSKTENTPRTHADSSRSWRTTLNPEALITHPEFLTLRQRNACRRWTFVDGP